MRMSFGHHRGELLTSISTSYLDWVLRCADAASPDLKRAIRVELARRQGGRAGTKADAAATNGTNALDVRSIIKTWYREMAKSYHPDRTLDNGAVMKAVNHGYERLQESFGVSR